MKPSPIELKKPVASVSAVFASDISTTPCEVLNRRYLAEPDKAVAAYPGAKGDAVRALAFVAVHRKMQIEAAKPRVTEMLNEIERLRGLVLDLGGDPEKGGPATVRIVKPET